MTERNIGGQFLYRIGQRVIYTPEVFGTVYPSRRVRIVARTIEPALGKTYQIRHQNGRLGGYVPEAELAPETKGQS